MPLLIEKDAGLVDNNNFTSPAPGHSAAQVHSKGIKDLFRVRRKSAVISPPAPDQILFDGNNRDQSSATRRGLTDDNGRPGGPTQPRSGSGAGGSVATGRREYRSQSTVVNPVAAGLRPMTAGGGGDGSVTAGAARQRRVTNVVPPWTKPPLTEGINTDSPMSRLLNPASISSQTPPTTTTALSAVGPAEFLELFRSRTHSDPRQAAAVIEARRRRVSEVRATDRTTSFSPHRLSGRTNSSGSMAVPSSPQLPRSQVPADVKFTDNRQQPLPIPASANTAVSLTMSARIPLSIPENSVVHYECALNEGFSTPSITGNALTWMPQSAGQVPPSASTTLGQTFTAKNLYAPNGQHQRMRKLSVFTPSSVVGESQDVVGDELRVVAGRRSEARSRRYSEPVAPRGVSALSSVATKMQKRSSVLQAMANFPKFTATTPAPPISPSSLGIDLPHSLTGPFIIWKDRRRGTQMFQLPLDDEDGQIEFATELTGSDRNLMFAKIMKRHKCYELMPNSSKVILLDTELSVISAFYALIFNGIRAAPLWKTATKEVIGVLTVTDFIHVLKKFHHSKGHISEVESHKISDWLDILSYCHKPLVWINPDESLFDAINLLHDANVHRILVTDQLDGTVLYILTYKRILHFLYLLTYNLPQPTYMAMSIRDLGIGTYESIATTSMTSTIIEALSLLVENRVSALPVIDAAGRVLNIYSKADIINLVINESYQHLNITVGQALSLERLSFEGLYICKKSDLLCQVVDWLVRKNIHRLIIVDDNNRLEGILSLSDVVNFLVLKQSELNEVAQSENSSRDEMEFEFSEKL